KFCRPRENAGRDQIRAFQQKFRSLREAETQLRVSSKTGTGLLNFRSPVPVLELTLRNGTGQQILAVVAEAESSKPRPPRQGLGRAVYPWSTLIGGAVDGPALLAKFALEMGEVVEIMRRRRRGRRRHGLECRVLREGLDDHPKILLHVGDNVQPAARRENALTLPREFGCEDPALAMAVFPPRVGKINMHGLDRCRGHVVPQENPSVGAGQSNVANPPLGKARGRQQLVLADNLDAEEVDLGVGLGGREQEQTLAEAHLNFNGLV